jgi:phospho-N-acetylmuramoyl-pentapeptide-transferase
MIVAGCFGATLLWAQLDRASVLVLLSYAAALALLGFLDDTKKLRTGKKGLSARGKLRWQLALSLAAGAFLYLHPSDVSFPSDAAADATSLFVPCLDRAPRLGVLFVLLVLLVTAGSANAVNLTDGLDGLAAGVSILAALPLIALALAPGGAEGLPSVGGGAEVAVFLSALVGACLGFLWFNGHPAQIFMGDTGSLSIGGSLGLAAVLLKLELVLLVAGGVLVAEALSVVLQVSSFKLTRRRIFLIAPLHHHFQFKGWPETKVTMRFWIAGAILAWVSLAILRIG